MVSRKNITFLAAGLAFVVVAAIIVAVDFGNEPVPPAKPNTLDFLTISSSERVEKLDLSPEPGGAAANPISPSEPSASNTTTLRAFSGPERPAPEVDFHYRTSPNQDSPIQRALENAASQKYHLIYRPDLAPPATL